MPRYKMKESAFETPPENVYVVDLTGIDLMEGSKGPFLRWRWVIADIPEQEKYAGAFATTLTPVAATDGNRFGKFLKVFYPNAQVGFEGDTDAMVDSKIRVKGLIEHNKGVNNMGEDTIYCNIKKLFEGSVLIGAGIGRQDLDKDGKGKKVAETNGAGAEQPKTASAQAQAPVPTADIPW